MWGPKIGSDLAVTWSLNRTVIVTVTMTVTLVMLPTLEFGYMYRPSIPSPCAVRGDVRGALVGTG